MALFVLSKSFMDQEHRQSQVQGIHHLLSHLHGEISCLEKSYSSVTRVLKNLESAPGAQGIGALSEGLARSCFFDQWNALLDACEKANLEADTNLFLHLDQWRVFPSQEPDLRPELLRIEELIQIYKQA